LEKKKKPTFFVFMKSRREDYEGSPQFRTQMGDGYDFFASVRDGVSIQHAFRLTNLVLVLVVAVKFPNIGKTLRTAITKQDRVTADSNAFMTLFEADFQLAAHERNLLS
jgi:hypothetical protein